MHSACLFSLTAFLALPLAYAETIDIKVGNKGLNFDPDTVTAKKGDLLNFFFYPGDHSVAQSTFDKPCVAVDNGPYSGFLPGDTNPKKAFQVTVNNTDPLYLYCSKGDHCNDGMAMIVNPPGKPKDLPAYLAAAKTANPTSPSAIAGGVFVQADANSGTNSASASASSASASAAASSAGASSASAASGTSAGASSTSAAPATTSSAKSAAVSTFGGKDIGLLVAMLAAVGIVRAL